MGEGDENEAESNERSLALSPTWSVAIVLSVFVLVSLIVERSIHRLSTVSSTTVLHFKSLPQDLEPSLLTFFVIVSQWLRKTKRKPLFAALEKMKQGSLLIHQKWNLYVFGFLNKFLFPFFQSWCCLASSHFFLQLPLAI